ncbi:uncharacterized protein LOC126373616 [Pectinophora gossypiella]|uniref:uncharacterized protein LOC126373616 n=1 Tax=Pectinophora gossypiella TaxID=13191 RepID=UPI00214EAD56|nr:uncharacterized protein LOC126373616 [Pectinophora gossypiella]XP_049875773.1 uncharacterized protein LOC126373616 [Pectinophora gossypiella]XP_049875774.1 uncharacterized protein LOC126373616 [Pectinophora gossypiella]XP_049875775.1 uncharacterized protein LOC126373616 [Pectinophora gossypiella]
METQQDEFMRQEVTEQLISNVIAYHADLENVANKMIEAATVSPGAQRTGNSLANEIGTATSGYNVDNAKDNISSDLSSSSSEPGTTEHKHVLEDFNNRYYNNGLEPPNGGPVRTKKNVSGDSDYDYDTDDLGPSANRNVYNGTPFEDLVPIGLGTARVSLNYFQSIKWDPASYAIATKKLMSAIFTRETMATHCLPGNETLPGRGTRKPLDERLVGDIIHTVVQLCKVPVKAVRKVITTMCYDERKVCDIRKRNKDSETSTTESFSDDTDSAGEGPSTTTH